MDRDEKWIAAREGLRPEVDNQEVDDRRWMTGDGSQEMDHERQMTIGLFPL